MNDVNMHLQFSSIRKREKLKKKRCKTCEMRQGQRRLCCDRCCFTIFFFAISLDIISTSNHEHEICVLINASADSRVVIDEFVFGDLKKDDTILK